MNRETSAQNAGTDSSPTVISTFAGCGGSSLGYHLAGFRELLAVEWDDNAAATFRANFPSVPLYHGDIAALSSSECMRLAGIGPGELDVFDGSPPCQGFSTAGRRNVADQRNSLFMEYARLLADMQPKAFVMENVTGMVTGKMRPVFRRIMTTLRGCGYVVAASILTASAYGVAQRRQRVIIIGARADLGITPTHPEPQTREMTFAEAVAGLSIPDEELRDAVRILGNKKAPAMLRVMKPGDSGRKYHPKGHWFGFLRLRLDRPAPTIPKTLFVGSCNFIHPHQNRNLTVSEYKRLASFPDDFVLTGDMKDRVARIGNSVPPLFMKAIATHVRKTILRK